MVVVREHCGFTWSWNGWTFTCTYRGSDPNHRHIERIKLREGWGTTTYFTSEELAASR